MGIDTDLWRPNTGRKTTDVLLYDKVRWEHAHYDAALIDRSVPRFEHKDARFARYATATASRIFMPRSPMQDHDLLVRARNPGIAYQQAPVLQCPDSRMGPPGLLAGPQLLSGQGQIRARNLGAVLG